MLSSSSPAQCPSRTSVARFFASKKLPARSLTWFTLAQIQSRSTIAIPFYKVDMTLYRNALRRLSSLWLCGFSTSQFSRIWIALLRLSVTLIVHQDTARKIMCEVVDIEFVTP
jgi:hypothetical protein